MTATSAIPGATVSVPAWAWMWLLAGGIFAGAKWLTWRTAAARLNCTTSMIYCLAWPGLDPAPFANRIAERQLSSWTDWMFATSKLGFGVLLVRMAAGVIHEHPSWGGSAGFAGILFCLHFGLFHLLALAWNAAGYRVQPIMQAPFRAVSLAEFWGRRWNRAFSDMAHLLLVRPLRTVCNRRGLLWLVYGISGLLHEVVISVPAAGGYGGPTAYFLVQAAGIEFQRSSVMCRCGCDRGLRGWLVTALFVLGPLPLLFHPPFLTNVIMPFVKLLGTMM